MSTARREKPPTPAAGVLVALAGNNRGKAVTRNPRTGYAWNPRIDVPAGCPSRSGMGFFHEPAAESFKDLKSLPISCMDCDPHFFETELKLFEGTGS
jgi:hypothetical protein